MTDAVSSSTAPIASVDALLAGLPTDEERQAIADAAAAAAVQARASGLALVKSLTATDDFTKTLKAAQEIAKSMAGDPLVGAHLNCMIQGMQTLATSIDYAA